MPVTGATTLPVASRDRAWDGAGAARRVFEFCTNEAGTVNVACVSRAFLWRRPDTDGTAAAHFSLGFCDVIDGRLQIVPRGIAATAGGRGVGAADIPEASKAAIRSRICTIYDRVRAVHETWPLCPFRAAITAAANGESWEGTIAFEGQTTGDERRIKAGALRWENLPVPLIFDRNDLDHTGMVIGTVDEITRQGGKIIASGHLSDSQDPETQAAVVRVRELLAEGAVGVSILTDDDEWEEQGDVEVVTKARIRHVAIVDVPAFNRAQIALVAAAEESWFTDPRFGWKDGRPPTDALDGDHDERLVFQEPDRPEEERQLGCPLTITDDGRIFGHAALFGRCHLGFPGTCIRPPKEPAAYRGFLTGARIPGIPTGPVVMKTTHASLRANAEAAQHHYHDTGYAVADVTVGPDPYGLWVAGALREGVSQSDIEALRASALSGDWRDFGGKLKLIGLLAVNAPGYRVARALAASAGLITVGPGCDTCPEEMPLEDRVRILERLYADSLVAGL